jgi:hypothetical protein
MVLSVRLILWFNPKVVYHWLCRDSATTTGDEPPPQG